MDKEDVRLKVDHIKAQGLKVSEHLNDEEWALMYSFPRPTPERLANMRQKAAEARETKKLAMAHMREKLSRDYDDALDELVPLAMLVLEDAMHDPSVTNRLKAAMEVLNRRFGRASQQVNITKDAEELVYKSTVLDAMKEGEAASRN